MCFFLDNKAVLFCVMMQREMCTVKHAIYAFFKAREGKQSVPKIRKFRRRFKEANALCCFPPLFIRTNNAHLVQDDPDQK